MRLQLHATLQCDSYECSATCEVPVRITLRESEAGPPYVDLTPENLPPGWVAKPVSYDPEDNYYCPLHADTKY